MPIRTTMTWVSAQKRWIKKYRNKMYSISAKQLGTPPTKEGSIFAANQWWQDKQDELEAANPKKQSIYMERQKEMRAWLLTHKGIDTPEVTSPHFAQFNWTSLPPEAKAVWADRLSAQKQTQTIAQALADFLAKKQAEIGSGLSSGRYDTLTRCCSGFVEFVGSTLLSELNGIHLSTFHTHLLKQIKKGVWTTYYARDQLAAAKQFIRWLWENDKIAQLPRNFKSLTIVLKAAKPTHFTAAEIAQILGGSTEREKLYWLLMINCGMTQKDISDLHPSEVDWTDGRIKRKRSKTQKHSGVPEIDYLLWAETFELLKQYGLRTGERVLLNDNGKPLKVSEMRNGKIVKIDCVGQSYARRCETLGIAHPKPPKTFRATGAHLLATKYGDWISGYYLGHSPKGVAQKHYTGISQLDDPLEWLRKELLG